MSISQTSSHGFESCQIPKGLSSIISPQTFGDRLSHMAHLRTQEWPWGHNIYLLYVQLSIRTQFSRPLAAYLSPMFMSVDISRRHV